MTQQGNRSSDIPAASAVVRFSLDWNEKEWATLQRLFEDFRTRRMADSWDVGFTERNEPQFYLFNGVAPDAFLSVSRVITKNARRYILENRHGEVLSEGSELPSMTNYLLYKRAPTPFRRRDGTHLG